jgi:peroxiredoxin
MQFQKTLIDRNKTKWVGLFFQGVQPVMSGPYPTPQTQEEYNAEFKYQKTHYFDNINLQDPRFWRTNFFPQKINDYLEKQVEQHPDSLANAASKLAAETMGDSISFQLMINTLIQFSVKSNIMGMENIWAKLVEDYYHKGFLNWLDSAQVANIEFEYKKIRFNRVGMTAHDMELRDTTGKKVKLYDLGAKYTLLYFYEPSCGHCIETTPKIHDQIYKKYADMGLDVVAVCITLEEKEWREFVNKNHLEGTQWHNVWDPERKSRFWDFYDTSVTPSIYILDKDKKIIAKKIDVASMDMIFGKLLQDI